MKFFNNVSLLRFNVLIFAVRKFAVFSHLAKIGVERPVRSDQIVLILIHSMPDRFHALVSVLWSLRLCGFVVKMASLWPRVPSHLERFQPLLTKLESAQ